MIQSSLTGPTTLDTQLPRFLRIFTGVTNFGEISRRRTDSDYPSYLVSVEWSVGGMPLRGDFILTVSGARVFFLLATAGEDLFSQHQADFAQMMESFATFPAPGSGPVAADADPEVLLDAIGDRVSLLRGLPAISPLDRNFQTRDQFVGENRLPNDETVQETELLKDLCVPLDLCSESDDLVQLLTALRGRGVLGFYETGKNSLTVVTDQDGLDPLAWLTYAHEYAHALQDQHFDLSTLLDEGDVSFDSDKAVRALVEGDARLSEFLFYESLPTDQQVPLAASLEEKTLEFSRSQEARDAPPIITETFGWEHAAGTDLVFRLYLEGGIRAINEAYKRPPQSTEQVIHPEKYLNGEEPHIVELPDLASALGADWQQRDSGVMGELLTMVYLSSFLTGDKAQVAAQGWGGDRYVLLKDSEDRLVIAIRFSWDTVTDAIEFFQVYLDFVEEKSRGEWDLLQTEGRSRFWVGEDISVYVALEDDDAVLVIGPDRATVETLVEEISQSSS